MQGRLSMLGMLVRLWEILVKKKKHQKELNEHEALFVLVYTIQLYFYSAAFTFSYNGKYNNKIQHKHALW